jgi:UDP-N-acetyl-D-mannosaminuronic acid transferase (WecB/TagA/CpsF family)
MVPSSVPRFNVLGIEVSALGFAATRDLIVGTRGQLRCGYICLGTVHGLTAARADDHLRRIFNNAWLTTPDGMPLVWLGPPGTERVYDPDPMLAVCDAGVLIGVGAAFDLHSGRVRQAPSWTQRSGFEWLFRLATEPRRPGPRYLKTNPLFTLRVIAQRIGLKKYPFQIKGGEGGTANGFRQRRNLE